MSDLISFLNNPIASALLGVVLAQLIQFLLKRLYPQMAVWKAAILNLSIILSLFGAYVGYVIYKAPAFPDSRSVMADVHWRTEISQADEPEAWPFKESRYMLSCLGGDGDYSVYLVKLEDITFISPRSLDFLPTYYGLENSRSGWEKGETQLLKGHSPKAFKKYVDYSLSLCKEAEARKKHSNTEQAPVEKN